MANDTLEKRHEWLAQTQHVIDDIHIERQRQYDVEGREPQHDDLYCGNNGGELALAGAAYAISGASYSAPTGIKPQLETAARNGWPFTNGFKPKDARRDLVRAAALLVAEIERLDRAAASSN